jgi:hypothetical protein
MLANKPPAPVTVRGLQVGQYGFGEEVVSSRSHIDGALDDLRLIEPTREQARSVVRTFVDALEAEAAADLLDEMRRLLTADQLADFKVALDRQGRARELKVVTTGNSTFRTMVLGSSDLGDFESTIEAVAKCMTRNDPRFGVAPRSAQPRGRRGGGSRAITRRVWKTRLYRYQKPAVSRRCAESRNPGSSSPLRCLRSRAG